MAPETALATSTSTRRALLAGSIGALVAYAAHALGRPLPARAEGETVVVGGEYTTATSVTRIANSTNSATVIRAESSTGIGIHSTSSSDIGVFGSSGSVIGVLGASSTGVGVFGSSTSNIGVQGSSTSRIGVFGSTSASGQPAMLGQAFGGNTGVFGVSGGGSLPASPAKTGVYGYAVQDATARGVRGSSNAGVGVQGDAATGHGVYGETVTGRAVRGTATGAGVGVRADAPNTGTALQVFGKAMFSRSGRVRMLAGQSSIAKTGVVLSSASLVLAVLQTNRAGVYVRAVVASPSTGSFRIYLNTAVPGTTYVAWFILN